MFFLPFVFLYFFHVLLRFLRERGKEQGDHVLTNHPPPVRMGTVAFGLPGMGGIDFHLIGGGAAPGHLTRVLVLTRLGKGKHLFPLKVFIAPPCGRTAGQRADAHSSPP